MLGLGTASLPNSLDHDRYVFGCLCNQGACFALLAGRTTDLTGHFTHPLNSNGDKVAATTVLSRRVSHLLNHFFHLFHGNANTLAAFGLLDSSPGNGINLQAGLLYAGNYFVKCVTRKFRKFLAGADG